MNGEQGARLGRAVGYENGYWWGKITGAIVSGVLGSVSSFTGGFGYLKICGILATTGVGYLVGGTYGAKRSSEYCEKKGKELAISNKTDKEIINICESESAIQGGLVGGLIGATIGAVPLIMMSSCSSDPFLEPLGEVSDNTSAVK